MAVAHKGSISMGLVLIPVGMYKTTQDNDIHFNQLEKESKARIKYKKYCSHCGKEVTSADIIKGYEYEKNKYVVMGTNEKLLVLYPTKDGIIVKTLFYQDEIVAMPKPVQKLKLDENELNMAKMLIENMTKPFVAEEFQDEYQARLREAIMKKIQGQEIVAVDNIGPSNVIDLMEALQKSLELSQEPDEKSRKQLTGTA